MFEIIGMLVVGAICLFGIFFCDGNKDSSDYNISLNHTSEKIE
jgi:hypothetical protein